MVAFGIQDIISLYSTIAPQLATVKPSLFFSSLKNHKITKLFPFRRQLLLRLLRWFTAKTVYNNFHHFHSTGTVRRKALELGLEIRFFFFTEPGSTLFGVKFSLHKARCSLIANTLKNCRSTAHFSSLTFLRLDQFDQVCLHFFLSGFFFCRCVHRAPLYASATFPCVGEDFSLPISASCIRESACKSRIFRAWSWCCWCYIEHVTQPLREVSRTEHSLQRQRGLFWCTVKLVVVIWRRAFRRSHAIDRWPLACISDCDTPTHTQKHTCTVLELYLRIQRNRIR